MAGSSQGARERTKTTTSNPGNTSGTMTSTMRRNTAVTLKVSAPENETYISRVLLLIWGFLLIVSWVLLVVAFTLPDWIEGTEPTDDSDRPFLQREVGLFRQCEQYATGTLTGVTAEPENCFSAGFTSSNIDAWYASGVLFVIGVLFLTVTIVLALSAACIGRGTIAALAKLSMSITSIFFMIAVLLFPLGFIYLDDQCPVGNEQPQCGLRCTDPTKGMDYFTLCGPYEVGAASFLTFAALVIFFVSSFCAACVRSV